MRGKNIRIYLADGTANGIRHAELGNWTGQALLIPRTLFAQAYQWPEIQRPGVYFLFGAESEDERRQVYIGEAENVLRRLEDHMRGKDFWEQVVVFSSKDENLTKAHVKYLESNLIRTALLAGRYKCENSSNSSAASLPRGDVDMMDEFIDNLKVLLTALGHPVLETVIRIQKVREVEQPSTTPGSLEILPLEQELFLLNTTRNGAKAEGYPTSDGFVVLKGAIAYRRNGETHSFNRIKSALVSDGTLAEVESGSNHLILTNDYLFKSPSAAACVITGASLNGREVWKTTGGVTLRDWELSQVRQDGI